MYILVAERILLMLALSPSHSLVFVVSENASFAYE